MLDTKRLQQRIGDIAASFRAYLDLSQKDRAKLTKTDRRRILELEVDLNEILEPQARSELIIDVHMVARFFGVTIRTVQNWVKSGCPRLKHGLYDLRAIMDWWLESDNSGGKNDGDDVKAVRLDLLKERVLICRIKRKKEEEELVPRVEIADQWALRVSEVTSGLSHFESRIAAVLPDDIRAEMRIKIKSEIRKLLDAYARKGRYCPKPAK